MHSMKNPCYFYRSPTKLRENNVFSYVSLSIGGWGPCAGPQIHPFFRGPQPWPPLYKALDVPSDMFKLVQLGPYTTGTSLPHLGVHSNLFTMKHGLSESRWLAYDWNVRYLAQLTWQSYQSPPSWWWCRGPSHPRYLLTWQSYQSPPWWWCRGPSHPRYLLTWQSYQSPPSWWWCRGPSPPPGIDSLDSPIRALLLDGGVEAPPHPQVLTHLTVLSEPSFLMVV